MNCERCNSMLGDGAAFRVRSDILNLNACGRCAKEASDLHLTVEPLMNVTEDADSKGERAAASSKTHFASPTKAGDRPFRPDVSSV